MTTEGHIFFNSLLSRRKKKYIINDDNIYEDNNMILNDDIKEQSIVKEYIKVVAPMVRFSKLPFRLLCRQYGADLCYTPMIIAEGFNSSEYARDSDFSTNSKDMPLVVQFASNDPCELALAAEKTINNVDAININCGCPQGWAMKKGIGACLSSQPQLVKELVTAVKSVTNLPVSIKIRIHKDGIKETINLVQQAEMAGVAYITMHGRTAKGNGKPVNIESIKLVKDIAKVPIVANGDIYTPNDMNNMILSTNADGVMCARGIMLNPAMFSGHNKCPLICAQDYLKYALNYGGIVRIHRGHLQDMLSTNLSCDERKEFSSLCSMLGIVSFFSDRGWWPYTPQEEDVVVV